LISETWLLLQVELACRILDGGPFRDDPNKTITVQPAKFEMRGDQYIPKKKPNNRKKKKVVKEEKMLGWGGFDDQLPPTQVQPPG
jgi:HIV Tat-specific factor 1